jgi:UDP-3-O-[3-hydroxymyristoyl] glucosamine N-acyltransferase
MRMSERPFVNAAELAARLGGVLEGDATAVIRGVAPLQSAGPTDLSGVGSDKYVPLVASSAAAVVLAPAGWDIPGNRTLIRVADPDLAMCEVLTLFGPPPQRVTPGVHASAVVGDSADISGAAIGPHAVVSPGATVGAGSQLHAGVFVGDRARIGRDCVLYPGVVVRERVTIGDRVVIHPNSVIGADGFGYLNRDGRHVKIPQIGIVSIEDDVEIGANCAIDRARSGVTRIGRGTKIDNLVQIGHNCDIGEACIIIAQCGLSGSVTLENGVLLAGQVGIADHVRIAARAVIAAKAGVMSDVPPGDAVSGIPAVPRREFFKRTAALKRLPELLAQVRELVERVERLESSNDHSEGS